MKEITKADAIIAINPDSKFSYFHPPKDEINWISEDISQPTEEEIQTKLTELINAEPMRLLREERNRRLTETDWKDLPSYPGTDQNDWRTYRQALRDLPSTAEPQLDEQGNLTNVTWPTKPE